MITRGTVEEKKYFRTIENVNRLSELVEMNAKESIRIVSYQSQLLWSHYNTVIFLIVFVLII